jgi:hypothetical protein
MNGQEKENLACGMHAMAQLLERMATEIATGQPISDRDALRRVRVFCVFNESYLDDID